MKARILVVDDEPKMAASLAEALRRAGHACHTATRGDEALHVLATHGADVVVSDRRMPGMDGLALMAAIHDRAPDLPVILITAYGDVRGAVEAMKRGAFDYLTKPFDHADLRGRVDRALELTALRRENRLLRRRLGERWLRDMVAESSAMRAVLAMVDRAAPSEATVLIQGESGTGKELVARRLHVQSRRADSPFVAVNAKAFAAGVLESELFGHEKGAFTGADSVRQGCFERADGGTLFLDEIGEIDLAFQAKLLRVLQEGEVLRVGGHEPTRVNVRCVAATNRDLRAAIAEGRFREDLFYRLEVIPIRLPPLRDRAADIVPLARHFLARLEADGRARVFSPEAIALLESHPWPGNVRELENAVERAVVLAAGRVIGPDDLLLERHDGRPPSMASDPDTESETLRAGIDRFTAQRIRDALAAHRGRRGAAAEALGVDRSTLFRLVRRLEIK